MVLCGMVSPTACPAKLSGTLIVVQLLEDVLPVSGPKYITPFW